MIKLPSLTGPGKTTGRLFRSSDDENEPICSCGSIDYSLATLLLVR